MRILLLCLLTLLNIAPACAWNLRYLGQQVVPAGQEFAGTVVGGLSGLDYDAARGVFYALSDDRFGQAIGRFYTLKLDLGAFNTRAEPGQAGVTFLAVTLLRDPAGKPYPRRTVDPEALRLAPDGKRLIWASEGDADNGFPPFVAEATLEGEYRRTYPLPARYLPRNGSGVRPNLAFESLALAPGSQRVFAAVENALQQDGPVADARHGSACRVLVYDLTSARAVAEYVYLTDPLPQASPLAGVFQTNGLVELLAIDDHNFIAVERSYSPLNGFGARLYLASLDDATDVTTLPSLETNNYRPLKKRLLLDLASLGIPLDNLEGLSWGPTLPNGQRSLILVSDDNFRAAQFTQFLAFELAP